MNDVTTSNTAASITDEVTTTTIVNILQEMINKVAEDDKLTTKEQVNMVVALTGRQLQAGSLNLGYQKTIARLPEGVEKRIPLLNATSTPKAIR